MTYGKYIKKADALPILRDGGYVKIEWAGYNTYIYLFDKHGERVSRMTEGTHKALNLTVRHINLPEGGKSVRRYLPETVPAI